jgi:hypothetical protein
VTATNKDITIPDNVTSIDENAFSGRTKLGAITIPDSVTSIGDNAFKNSSITSIHLGSGLSNFFSQTFIGCYDLKTITISDANTSFTAENNCLLNTDKSVILGCGGSSIPTDAVSIEQYAFNGTSIETLTIPSGLTSIKINAFTDCSSLASINVDASNSTYNSENNCLIETSSHTLILGCKNSVIPSDVTTIYDGAFDGCSSLEALVIPSSVTSIGFSAFTSFPQISIFSQLTKQPASNYNVFGVKAIYWYSETSNTDGSHWHYVNDVPTVWVA